MIDIFEKAGSLIDLIQYQDGSIVSKEIIKTEKATLSLFAFDKGQGLSEHTAPFDALIYVVDGKAQVTVSAKANLVIAGQVIIMPAGKPHSVAALERFKMLLIMIRG